jgi:radical SAM protein with 4Fe4S-binding SPASM domain
MEHESLTAVKALSNYWLDRALARAEELGLHVPLHPAPFDLGAPAPAEGAADWPRNPLRRAPYCAYPFFHVSMSPDGQVLACPHSHGEQPYGQVSADTPLDRVWLNPRFMELRRRILECDPPDMCRRCSFLADRYPDVADLFVTRRN